MPNIWNKEKRIKNTRIFVGLVLFLFLGYMLRRALVVLYFTKRETAEKSNSPACKKEFDNE